MPASQAAQTGPTSAAGNALARLLALSENAILSIPEGQPERLFSSAGAAAAEYRGLAKRWHPDSGGSSKVSAHINVLWDAAEKAIATGAWKTPGLLSLTTADGRQMNVRYRRHHKIDVGEMYVGGSVLAFVLAPDMADLYDTARSTIANLSYADEAMRAEFSRYFPQELSAFDIEDGRRALVFKKTPDQVLLSDLLAHQGGRMDARHVAWIGNRLHNLAAYLGWAGLTHNAIGLDTIFVSPEFHSCSILGGFWYAKRAGERLTALPGRSVRYVTADMRQSAPNGTGTVTIASPRLDGELVRATSRALLGDESGTSFSRDRPAPDPVLRFLREPASGDALKDYREWADRILPAAFGARRFVEMKISPEEIYPPL